MTSGAYLLGFLMGTRGTLDADRSVMSMIVE